MTEFLRHLFLPHHSNNFRAKLLHLDFFAMYVILFFLFSISIRTVHRIDPNILGFATDIHVDQLLTLTNQKRSEAGLLALTLNSQLSEAAAGKARDMFTKNYWAHTAPDGVTPWDFINGSGYTYTVAGENLAKNFSNSGGVIEAWMNSPSHRENIMRGQYQDIGFAVVNGVLDGEEMTLVVQMFGKPAAGQIAQVETTTNTNVVPPLQIPVFGVAAQEEIPPQIASPDPATIAATLPVSPKEVLVPTLSAVTKAPLFDTPTLAKQLTLGLATILMIVLVVDMAYIWRKKIVRVGGRPTAHLLFLFIITGAIWYMSFGSIL